ncbi:MAG TPA: SMC-Scp complex subunit ScpB [Actinomycetota bacterium]|jgi:segregation and condensation protein B|nr:SMC-Scp complex subunit ScpB [Actinomycetota bacterium]
MTRLSAGLVEAILFASPEPVRPQDIAGAFGASPEEVAEAIDSLRLAYTERGAGVEVRRVGDAFRIYTRADFADAVGHFANRSRVGKLSRPALETLAIVAYRQPVSRGEISRVRGVNVDSVLQTLAERGLVTEVGRDSGPGRAPLYGTTPFFLEKIGLGSVADLPPLASFAPDPQTAADIERVLTSAPADESAPEE